MRTGFARGSHYGNAGGGSNYICLHEDRILAPKVHSSAYYAHVYGSEYHYSGISGLDDHDVPCAVCQTTRKSMMMIPGRNICQPGWITEYIGYLAAQRYTQTRSEFVCMDENAEPHPQSRPNDENGVLFHPAITRCGSFPCLPYVNDKILLCAVCTR